MGNVANQGAMNGVIMNGQPFLAQVCTFRELVYCQHALLGTLHTDEVTITHKHIACFFCDAYIINM